MMGSVKPNQSLSSRLSVPERPKISCSATAPTKGGMISGKTPRVWMRMAPRKSKRTVKYASGTAIRAAKMADMTATYRLLKNDSRIRSCAKKALKCPKVRLLSPSKKAVTNTLATGNTKNNKRKANTSPPASQTPGRTSAQMPAGRSASCGCRAACPSIAMAWVLCGAYLSAASACSAKLRARS